MRDMLASVSRRTSLHMPGAQGYAPFERPDVYSLETTELSVTDDLYHPTGAISRAEALAARSAGAAATLMLTGGSTAGMVAMLLYAARQGDTVILPRTAHMSAINACAVADIRPVFAGAVSGKTDRPYVPLASYVRAMDEHPEAKAVLVTRPDYYGMLGTLRAVAEQAKARGMLVLCDEAHGAHFNWDPQAQNAGACGADLFVQSAHKTLPALNGGAWLHAMRGVDVDRLRHMLRLTQTSSPSFTALMALDDARAWMDGHGAEACARLRTAIGAFHRKAAALGYTDGQDEPGASYDPLRLVLNAPQGGYRLAQQLSELSLDVEMADERRAVCILSLMDGEKRLVMLLAALKRIGAQESGALGKAVSPMPTELPPRVMTLNQAMFSPSEPVSITQAAGRVSARQVGLYPPGIALLTAGEVVTADLIKYLCSLPKSAAFGVSRNDTIECVREEEYKP